MWVYCPDKKSHWTLHPDWVSQIWEIFYEAEVDIFASQEIDFLYFLKYFYSAMMH